MHAKKLITELQQHLHDLITYLEASGRKGLPLLGSARVVLKGGALNSLIEKLERAKSSLVATNSFYLVSVLPFFDSWSEYQHTI